jgi:hypothetical protein
MTGSCGGGSSTAPPSTTTPTPSTVVLGDDNDPRENAIWFAANDNHDAKITAACMAIVTTNSLKAKRKHKVRWHIENDPYNECEDLDYSQVELRFEKKIWRVDADTLKPQGKKKRIDGKLKETATDVPDGKYAYVIYYKNLRASDPELDILGDCGGCGPD